MSRFVVGLVVGVILGGAGLQFAGGQAENVDFAIVIEPSANGAELSCIRGCAWLELSFSCDDGEECRTLIDESGVGGVGETPERP